MDRHITKLYDVNGKDYVIWAWKGDYINLGAGAETGIYEEGIGNVHWFTATDMAQDMELTLEDRSGNTIFNYTPEEKQWWINRFNPQVQNNQADDLVSTTVIHFSDSEKDQALWEALVKAESDPASSSGGRTFDEKNKTATLKW